MSAEDPNPFGEMGRDARGHLRPAKTAAQAASSLVGFGVMGIGGLLVLAGIVLKRADKSAWWTLALAVGIGFCYLGYWLYGRGQPSNRRGRDFRTGGDEHAEDRPPAGRSRDDD
jgi:hypothetical protein